jgi:transposase
MIPISFEPVLKHTRWLLLKRPENLSEKQLPKLAELLQYNLRSVRAYLLKEEFQLFWSYRSPYWAAKFSTNGAPVRCVQTSSQ